MVPVFKAAGIAEMTSLAVPACYKSVVVSYIASHRFNIHTQWWRFGGFWTGASTYNHGIQTGTGEAAGAHEPSRSLELGLKVRL